MEDYYKALGVDKTASKEEIKKAYRKLAHKHHPDKGGDEAVFKKISEAYAVLSNDEKRKQYDMFGKSGPSTGGTGGSAGGYGFNGFHTADFDFDIGDIFGDFFNFGSQSKRRQHNRGEDVAVRINVSLEDVIEDKTKKIKISKLERCDECSGSGAEKGSKIKKCSNCNGQGKIKAQVGPFTQIKTCTKCEGSGEVTDKPCKKCNGEGRVKKTKEIEINIPAGIDSGQAFRVKEEGNAGKKGKPSGDLIIEVFITNNTEFRREGSNLYKKVKINYTQAVLGDKIDIKLLSGKKIALKIPPGTPSGKIFRVSGKGLPQVGGYGYGDLFITTDVAVPSKVNKKQKKILEDLQKENL